jgi:hypothetical protein
MGMLHSFENSVRGRVASLVARIRDLESMLTATRHVEHNHLEDYTVAPHPPNEPRASCRTLLHIHLLVRTEICHEGGSRSRCHPSTIKVVSGPSPLPRSPPTTASTRSRVHLQSWSLMIPKSQTLMFPDSTWSPSRRSSWYIDMP